MIQRSDDTQNISRVSIAISLACACLALQGCSSVKKTLGIDRDPPNEYAVTPSAQPLEMPPDFSCLPLPAPGVERPQDRAARQAQDEKFLGSTGNKGTSSPGQKALLMESGAKPNQDDIRLAVDQEARMEVNTDKTVIEKLGIKKPKPKGDAVNPYAEAERLKEEGLAPNPNTCPEVLPPLPERNTPKKRNLPLPVEGVQ